MPNSKPKLQVVNACLILRLDGPIYGPADGIGFSDQPGPARGEPTMAHLLLIDDDPGLIPEQVRQAFPRPHYRVVVAGTGTEGLEHVRAESPDIILLDLRLPDQSGLEV
jgi:Response regulator receiver domain